MMYIYILNLYSRPIKVSEICFILVRQTRVHLLDLDNNKINFDV